MSRAQKSSYFKEKRRHSNFLNYGDARPKRAAIKNSNR